MPQELAKAYDPSAIEKKWAEFWLQEKLWEVTTPEQPDPANTFTLLLPPPNVTGRLHMGHMLNQTEMDIILRWHRMRGHRALWVPGTDHAGIATQMMVERRLASEGVERRELGREKFVERVWQWKEQYGGAITDQMKRLGASVDWSREYFTMDENLSAAVREAFVRLYETQDDTGKRLIYRGQYIVNWCPRCMTAISDLEVKHEDTPGKLYEIKYPVAGGGPNEFIVIATTRPETMLADVAVAVNAKDPRYKHLHGKKLRLPLAPEKRIAVDGREVSAEIPIILDEIAQPDFGTGAVKITPAHDPNDFAAGQRHALPAVNAMTDNAAMNENAGAYAGLDRFAARERVLEDLRAQGLLVGEKDHTIPLGRCDRCKTVVEPRLSKQWFVAVNRRVPAMGGESMASLATKVVEGANPAIRFTPENYRTIYLNWMANIYDWCISRQLWWGHRIPAWYCGNASCVHSKDFPGGEAIVGRSAPAKCPKCGSTELTQETDVLDTWFSSALLPFTVWGWPAQDDKTKKQIAAFYPTTLLITGFDILFFWVQRMVMMGTWFMLQEPMEVPASGRYAELGKQRALKEAVPFTEVYIHALVRDAERQKMSKTKGNVLDPIEVTEKYGTDAVRFALAAMASPGTDIAFNEARTEGYRAFANKIWNAARFILMNVERARQAGWWSVEEWLKVGDSTKTTLEDRWILSRWWRTTDELNRALAEYRFHEAAAVIYDFFWKDFCDWYIELVKPRLNSEGVEVQKLALFTVMGVMEGSLRLLAPFMPFITDELFEALYEGKPPKKSIALVEYPQFDETHLDATAEREMALVQQLIVMIREMRATVEVPLKEKTAITVQAHGDAGRIIKGNRDAIHRLANVSEVRLDGSSAGSAATREAADYTVALIYEKKVDVTAERERLSKELKKFESELEGKRKQLGNNGFVSKAPVEVVEGMKQRAAELEVLIEKNKSALAGLG